MLAPVAFAVGAAYAVVRSDIRQEVARLESLINNNNSGGGGSGGLSKAHVALAREIVDASTKLGWAGRLFNNDAYEKVCRLCSVAIERRLQAVEPERADQQAREVYKSFYECLALIQRKLKCMRGEGEFV